MNEETFDDIAEVYGNLGSYFLMEGDMDMAQAFYEKVVELYKDYEVEEERITEAQQMVNQMQEFKDINAKLKQAEMDENMTPQEKLDLEEKVTKRLT